MQYGGRYKAMNFADKAIQLREEGYIQFHDRDRQRTAGKCSRCNKPYTIESFAKNGEYKHYCLCVFCGSWSSMNGDGEFYYPPSSTMVNPKDQEKKDAARMFHYTHGLRLSSSYTDFKCFILAYTVCEIRAKNGGKRTESLEWLKPEDVRQIATNPADTNVEDFFRRFYKSKPSAKDKQLWIKDIVKATRRDLATLEFLEIHGISDIEKWYWDVKFPSIKPVEKIDPRRVL